MNNEQDTISLRQQTLLNYLDASDDQKLDPIRIMKGMFLFAMEAPDDWELPDDILYEFEPYEYGPYSAEIYADLRLLERLGYVRATVVPGRSWKYYSLTPSGAEVIQNLPEAISPAAVNYLHKLRNFVCGLSFRRLLDTVYERYPDYAVNSIFK